jgi:hypothetical protein
MVKMRYLFLKVRHKVKPQEAESAVEPTSLSRKHMLSLLATTLTMS